MARYYPPRTRHCSISSVRYIRILIIYDQTDNVKAQYFSEHVMLAARNVEVDVVNESILECISGESRTYTSADSTFIDSVLDDGCWTHEYLNTITVPGMLLHSTTLKAGCPIILLYNLDPSTGLNNGTWMIIISLGDQVLQARVLIGSHMGTIAFIPYISLNSSISWGLSFILRRR
jgi:ATP-dependent DNA helicase PIF1